MNERPIFSDLPSADANALNAVRALAPESLTVDQCSLLRSRRDYLDARDLNDFAKVLDGTMKGTDYKEVKEVKVSPVETKKIEATKYKKLSKDNFTRDVLVQIAIDAGLSVTDQDQKQDITDKLNTYFEDNKVLA